MTELHHPAAMRRDALAAVGRSPAAQSSARRSSTLRFFAHS
ncbi:MAG TPA: hypothetical protein PKJ45_05820 [Rubrivivax sp.]|nr:hypothetical protein [Rubrivivax sp.]